MKYVLLIFSAFSSLKLFGYAQQQVPCYFVFGDSTEDNGNNHLSALARPNYHFPYGIDYPSGPTGRVSNGRTVSDLIAEYLGFEDHIQPYANTYGKDILKGVNYASVGAGIRKTTGELLDGVISFDGQLQNHANTVSNIFSLLGENATNYLNTCLYLVRLGSNEYLPKHMLPFSNTSDEPEYSTRLIEEYSQKLKTLYSYGARKVAIFGLGQVGCAPALIAITLSRTCVDITNNEAQTFDALLPQLVDSLSHDLINSRFIFLNFSHMILTGIYAPESGITNTKTPCCIISPIGLCIPDSVPCKNRNTYAFWDGYHQTESFNKIIAKRAYRSATKFDCYPYDISTLAKLKL